MRLHMSSKVEPYCIRHILCSRTRNAHPSSKHRTWDSIDWAEFWCLRDWVCRAGRRRGQVNLRRALINYSIHLNFVSTSSSRWGGKVLNVLSTMTCLVRRWWYWMCLQIKNRKDWFLWEFRIHFRRLEFAIKTVSQWRRWLASHDRKCFSLAIDRSLWEWEMMRRNGQSLVTVCVMKFGIRQTFYWNICAFKIESSRRAADKMAQSSDYFAVTTSRLSSYYDSKLMPIMETHFSVINSIFCLCRERSISYEQDLLLTRQPSAISTYFHDKTVPSRLFVLVLWFRFRYCITHTTLDKVCFQVKRKRIWYLTNLLIWFWFTRDNIVRDVRIFSKIWYAVAFGADDRVLRILRV